MEHITPDQDWGVSGGVPHNVTVALKNGWLPTGEYGSWEINSIGWVRGDRRDYLIAVLTAQRSRRAVRDRHDRAHLFSGVRRPAALQGATESQPAVLSGELSPGR